MLSLPVSLSLRQRFLLSETERHAVRTDDEVKVDAEDGHEPQLHQAEALQSPSDVLDCLEGTLTWCKTWRGLLHFKTEDLCYFPADKTFSTESSTAAKMLVRGTVARRNIKHVDHVSYHICNAVLCLKEMQTC